MKRLPIFLTAFLLLSTAAAARAQADSTALVNLEAGSGGSVHTAAGVVKYRAVVGTIVVHARGWDDATADDDTPSAIMSYVAYFEEGADAAKRPVTFLFNGGPGSATVWLHMGAFGPRRVVTGDHAHTQGPPYDLVENQETLLDVSDLVFVDAPGTGFGRIFGKDKEKAFYGVDQDIHAFAQFITGFLSRYDRWNSPRYLFGESYGTMRGAALPLALEQQSVDLNGVVLLSCILDWDLMPDNPKLNPSIDEPYEVALPSYAATAWYHHKLPGQSGELRPLLDEVEHFATTDYALALQQGNSLSTERKQAIAEKLHDYTGLPVSYLLRSNLRIGYGTFEKNVLADQELTTGTLDTRFTGPTLDPLSETSGYDPQDAAISSAYVSAFNDYVRQTLNYKGSVSYEPGIGVYTSWDYRHQPPGAGHPLIQLPNVLPDLAAAMKRNPDLEVMVLGGYFDISTPYFEGWFETHHLQIPPRLQSNILYHYYPSGHMVYVHTPALKQMHDDVAAFIRETSNK